MLNCVHDRVFVFRGQRFFNAKIKDSIMIGSKISKKIAKRSSAIDFCVGYFRVPTVLKINMTRSITLVPEISRTTSQPCRTSSFACAQISAHVRVLPAGWPSSAQLLGGCSRFSSARLSTSFSTRTRIGIQFQPLGLLYIAIQSALSNDAESERIILWSTEIKLISVEWQSRTERDKET